MKLPRTIGLAVAVLLVASTVAVPAWISGAAAAAPTVNRWMLMCHLSSRCPAPSNSGSEVMLFHLRFGKLLMAAVIRR